MTQAKTKTKKNDELSVIILLYKNPNFGEGFSKPFDLEICGKKMWKWVELACFGLQVKTTLCTPNSNVLELIKPMLTNSKFTLVLYSDTPLFSHFTLDKIFHYAKKHNSNFIALERGFLFNTEYAKKATTVPTVPVQEFDEDSFFMVEDFCAFEFTNTIIKENILEFHKMHGTCIMDDATTFIDADCEIASGVTIYPNNSILGKSRIGKNAVLHNGNVIISSDIGAGAILNGAYIKNAKIEKGQEVKAFERIEEE